MDIKFSKKEELMNLITKIVSSCLEKLLLIPEVKYEDKPISNINEVTTIKLSDNERRELMTIWKNDRDMVLLSYIKGEPNHPKDIILGNHVWIGKNATILKGVTIGHDSIIAMGSVVTKSCEPNSIRAGNPAKVVKTDITWDY